MKGRSHRFKDFRLFLSGAQQYIRRGMVQAAGCSISPCHLIVVADIAIADIIGYGSSPSRCEPDAFVATGQTWDLPVPAQRASTHARFCDHAGPSRHSRSRACPYRLPPSQQRRHPGYESLRGSMAGLCAPLPTLRRRPYGRPRTARGRCGSLLRHRVGLAPTTRCRSPGALRKFLFGLLGSSPQEAALARSCLIAIDFLRDEHGIAANDTRHPDVMSEIPWPPEAG